MARAKAASVLAPSLLLLSLALAAESTALPAALAPVIAAALRTGAAAAAAFLMPLVTKLFLLSEWAKAVANITVRVSKREKDFIVLIFFIEL